MARKPRIHFAGALYHFMVRGNRGQIVFPEEDDFRLYLKFLKEYKAKLNFHLYAVGRVKIVSLLMIRLSLQHRVYAYGPSSENWLKAKTQILKNYSLDIRLNERILIMRRQKKDLPKQLFH